MKLNESEKKCLKELAIAADYPEHCILFFSHITNYTGLNLTQARRAVRSLARKGLAEHKTAFDCDEGMVMGSGYIVTRMGQSTAKALELTPCQN